MKKERLYHAVTDQMINLIKNGSYPTGSRLPGERELAKRFDVSRVTVRDAAIALQALGYIHVKNGSGAYVLNPAGRQARELPNVSAFELTEARLLFESEAAALAAREISDETLKHLDELIKTMSNDDPSGEKQSQHADREFHITIAAASGNSAVQYIVESLWKLRTELPAVKKVHAATCSDENAFDRGSEHLEILTALRNHDTSAARLAMQNHFRRLLESMIDVTEEQALEKLRQKATESRRRYLQTAEPDKTR